MTIKEVIAIDGPAGAGKSTVARLLAARLGFLYLDTGALYRALTLKALASGVDLECEEALVSLVRDTRLDLRETGQVTQVFLDGADVTAQVRTPEVTEKTFYLARSPGARKALLPVQRAFAARDSLVAEGRDTTTVVFPGACLKVYLDAPLEVRATRRESDLRRAGRSVSHAGVAREIAGRDHLDLSRAVAPLRRSPEAFYLDSGGKTVEEVVEIIAGLYRSRHRGGPGEADQRR